MTAGSDLLKPQRSAPTVPAKGSDPTISVLIPCYNRQDTLALCLESVLSTGYERLQIVVSDNGSTDGSADLVRAFSRRDSRILLLAHGANRGPLPNWEACLNAATGTWIHWLWSDDWIEPDFYRCMIDGIERRSAGMAQCASRIVCPEDGWWHTHFSLPDIERSGMEYLALALAGSVVPQSPAACLLRAESVRKHFHHAIPKVAGLDCTGRAIGADALMIAGAALDSTRVFTHPAPLVNFRSHAGSITASSLSRTVDSHYAFARCWWSRRHKLPRTMNALDFIRLIRRRQFRALLQASW
jgi:glycosyltransferase involved in cell wall biosynthesis